MMADTTDAALMRRLVLSWAFTPPDRISRCADSKIFRRLQTWRPYCAIPLFFCAISVLVRCILDFTNGASMPLVATWSLLSLYLFCLAAYC